MNISSALSASNSIYATAVRNFHASGNALNLGDQQPTSSSTFVKSVRGKNTGGSPMPAQPANRFGGPLPAQQVLNQGLDQGLSRFHGPLPTQTQNRFGGPLPAQQVLQPETAVQANRFSGPLPSQSGNRFEGPLPGQQVFQQVSAAYVGQATLLSGNSASGEPVDFPA